MVPLSEFRPVAPGWVMMADIGMVLMMVVPCLVVEGETPLMFRIVGLFPVPPAWEVVMMVVGLPSAEVTSLRIVPAGRGPFVWGKSRTLVKHLERERSRLRSFKIPPVLFLHSCR